MTTRSAEGRPMAPLHAYFYAVAPFPVAPGPVTPTSSMNCSMQWAAAGTFTLTLSEPLNDAEMTVSCHIDSGAANGMTISVADAGPPPLPALPNTVKNVIVYACIAAAAVATDPNAIMIVVSRVNQ